MWRSKLGGEFPRDLIDSLDSKHLCLLKQLRTKPHNAHCADCGRSNNTWASVNLGVFLCDRCADVHRALGTHISKVKGCQGTDLWGPDEIALMQELDLVLPNKQMYISGVHGSAKDDPAKEELMDLCLKKYGMKTCNDVPVRKKQASLISPSLTVSDARIEQPWLGQSSDKSLSLPRKCDAKLSGVEDSFSNRADCCASLKEASHFSFDDFFAILEPTVTLGNLKHCQEEVPTSTAVPRPAALKRTSTDEVFEGFESW